MSRDSTLMLCGTALIIGSAATTGDFGWFGALILVLQILFGGDS